MGLSKICFLIFVFLKQFYVFKSGTIQPGDFFLVISFIFILIDKRSFCNFKLERIDYYLMLFLIFVIFINSSYYYIESKFSFIVGIFYYIFNVITILVTRFHTKNNRFNELLCKVLKLNLITQLIFYLLGIGKYYLGIRYMGTFNDPNQFAFFIFSTYLAMCILAKHLKIKYYIYTLISLFLIIESSSTGVLMGISIFLCIDYFIYFVKRYNFNLFTVKVKNKYIFIILAILSFLCLLPDEIFTSYFKDAFIFERLEEKILKLNDEESSLLADRGIDKLIMYPEYIVFGAGEAEYSRFSKVDYQGEIHSTLPSLLFCYGVIPTLILLIWVKKNIRHVPAEAIAVYIGLFTESCFLLNQRQPFFWMIFVLGTVYTKKDVIKK